MNDNSLIWTKSQCAEAFDELLIKIALSSFAEMEGRELLKENERLKQEPEFQLPPDHEKTINKIIRKQKFQKSVKVIGKGFYRVMNKVALIFLALSITTAATMVASAEFRKAIYKLIMTDEEIYTLIKLDDSTALEFVEADVFTWDHAFAPTMLPKGYIVDEVIELDDLSKITYKKDDGGYIRFAQDSSRAASTIQIDTENAQLVEKVFINDSEALLVSKDGINQIVWRIGNVMLRITSNESTETIVAIAENVKLLR